MTLQTVTSVTSSLRITGGKAAAKNTIGRSGKNGNPRKRRCEDEDVDEDRHAPSPNNKRRKTGPEKAAAASGRSEKSKTGKKTSNTSQPSKAPVRARPQTRSQTTKAPGNLSRPPRRSDRQQTPEEEREEAPDEGKVNDPRQRYWEGVLQEGLTAAGIDIDRISDLDTLTVRLPYEKICLAIAPVWMLAHEAGTCNFALAVPDAVQQWHRASYQPPTNVPKELGTLCCDHSALLIPIQMTEADTTGESEEGLIRTVRPVLPHPGEPPKPFKHVFLVIAEQIPTKGLQNVTYVKTTFIDSSLDRRIKKKMRFVAREAIINSAWAERLPGRARQHAQNNPARSRFDFDYETWGAAPIQTQETCVVHTILNAWALLLGLRLAKTIASTSPRHLSIQDYQIARQLIRRVRKHRLDLGTIRAFLQARGFAEVETRQKVAAMRPANDVRTRNVSARRLQEFIDGQNA